MNNKRINSYERFIDKLLNYYKDLRIPEDKILKLENIFKNKIYNELQTRDDSSCFIIRDFTNSKKMNINLINKNLWCKSEVDKLLVGTKVPNWQLGWSNISDDEWVSDMVHHIFWFINQYIYRGYYINLMASILLTYGRVCDFRSNSIQRFILPASKYKYKDFALSIKHNSNRRVNMVKKYLNIINSLDPHVNKVNFYFIKSKELYANYFEEEAITSLDNLIHTIIDYIKYHKRLPTMGRSEGIENLCNVLSMNSKVKQDLKDLYKIRCRFTAHPAIAKWWDFFDIYEESIDRIFMSVQKTIIKFYHYERKNRIIDDNPKKWSDWFLENVDIIFDITWFHNLPEIN